MLLIILNKIIQFVLKHWKVFLFLLISGLVFVNFKYISNLKKQNIEYVKQTEAKIALLENRVQEEQSNNKILNDSINKYRSDYEESQKQIQKYAEENTRLKKSFNELRQKINKIDYTNDKKVLETQINDVFKENNKKLEEI